MTILNQSFLKVFGENGCLPETRKAAPVSSVSSSSHKTAAVSFPAGEMNFSLRVDQKEAPVKMSSRSSALLNEREGIFSFEEEKRRRNPIPEMEYSYSEEEECEMNERVPQLRVCRPENCACEPKISSCCQQEPKRESAANRGASVSRFVMREWPAEYRRICERGAAEFAELADAVEETSAEGGKIFGFGGWGEQTGVSTLVLGLLQEMLRRRQRVLLVDANFQHPEMAKLFGVPAETGWENLLRGPEDGVESGLIRVDTEEFPFYFLPLVRETVPEAVNMVCRKSWCRRFLELTESFDLVLIDHGSLRTGNDREKIFEILRFGCDGYFMVTDKRSRFNADSADFSALSNGSRLSCFGVIENFT